MIKCTGFIGLGAIGGKQDSFGISDRSCVKVYVVMSSSLNSCLQTGDSSPSWPLTPPFMETSGSAPDEAVVIAAIAMGPWMLSACSFNHSLIHSFNKCLLNVYYGTVQNTGGKMVSKTAHLYFHGVYSL